MLTPLTKSAIAVLDDIYMRGENSFQEIASLSENEVGSLLYKLNSGGLIKLINREYPTKISSYKLARAPLEISLLDILEATGEHLNCNHVTSEEFYWRYGKAAQKLGVINHITRGYLSEIKLVDL